MKPAAGSVCAEQQNSPARVRPGLFKDRMRRFGSIAAIYQPPAGSPWRRDQSPHIAAAIGVAVAIIGRAADEEAGSAMPAAPAAMPPATMPTVTGKRGRGCRG